MPRRHSNFSIVEAVVVVADLRIRGPGEWSELSPLVRLHHYFWDFDESTSDFVVGAGLFVHALGFPFAK